MKTKKLLGMTIALVLGVIGAQADTHYVSPSGGNSSPFTSWGTAAREIDNAVRAASAGDTVLVADGTYDTADDRIDDLLTIVVLLKAVTVKSVNGPDSTFIVGSSDSGTHGPAAVRCAWLEAGAVIDGFTLTNGYTLAEGGSTLYGQCGGGAFIYQDGTLTNCTIIGNGAYGDGGGVHLMGGGTLNGCTVAGNSAGDAGGGVYFYNNGTLNNCILSGNSAVSSGGGVYFKNNGTVNDCVVSGNSAVSSGGGVYFKNNGTLNDCILSGNSAVSSGGGGYVNNDGTLNNCTLSGNSSGYRGGGIYCYYGGTLNNSILSGNSAVSYGGGAFIYIDGSLNNCTLSGNSSGDRGGGIYCYYGGTLNNSILWGNSAVSYGGGAFINGDGSLYNCTLSGNSSDSRGGGVFCSSSGTLKNTILWGNTASDLEDNWGVLDDDISFDNTCTTPSIGNGCITADPQFVDEGGGDYRLQASSPCIDAGTTLAWITEDNEGTLRPFDGDGDGSALHDIGAFESDVDTTPLVVITDPSATVTGETSSTSVNGTNNAWVVGTMSWLNDANGSSGTFPVSGLAFEAPSIPLDVGTNLITVSGRNAHGTIASDNITITRQLGEHDGFSLTHYVATGGGNLWPFTNWVTAATDIQDAVVTAASGDTVLVDDGVYSSGGAEVYSMSNRVALTKAVTLQSVNGPEVTFIVGVGPRGTEAVRCVYLTTGAEISGFTLTNGHTRIAGLLHEENSGGGVWLDGGTVTDCEMRGNECTSYGGGAYLHRGGTVKNSTISANSSGIVGGGVYLYEGGIVNNSVISGNSSMSSGDGVYCRDGGTLNHCTISDNGGNGVNCYLGGNLNNCIIWDNPADSGNDNWSNNGGSFANTCTTPTIGSNCVNTDPQFVDSGAGDYRLRFGSPCIDAGITLASINDDIAGAPRPLDGDNNGSTLYDIGAYELRLSIVLNSDNSGSGSLRQTIDDAPPGGGIIFTNTLAGQTITLTSGQITVDKDFAIDASALSSGITIDGNGSSRIFEFASGAFNQLKHLTLTNGYSGEDGGAIYVNAGAVLTLSNATLTGNSADRYGGSIDNYGTLTLNDCTIAGSSAIYGGSIDNYGTLALINSTLSGNSASFAGGGIYNWRGLIALNHSTLSDNSADSYGGGIRNYFGILNSTNSIIAGNSAQTGSNIDNYGGTLNTSANNLIDIDAQLAPLGDYGGATLTMLPTFGSPAINAGVTTSVTTDQRGYPRPDGGQVDIGAVEYQLGTDPAPPSNPSPADAGTGVSTAPQLSWTPSASASAYHPYLDDGQGGALSPLGSTSGSSFAVSGPLDYNTTYRWRIDYTVGGNILPGVVMSFTTRASTMVDTSADPGTSGDGFTSLRQALVDASSGETITFTNTLSGGTITLASGQITVDTTLTIDAASLAGGLTIDGNANGRIFEFAAGTSNLLNGLTLTNGLATGSSPDYDGGAIYLNSGADLTLTNITLSGNIAEYRGGAIYNSGGDLAIDSSIIEANAATNMGGAICSTGASDLRLTDTTLSGNESGLHGGAVYNYGDLEINRCTFSDNTAPSWGGGLGHGNAAQPGVVRNSTFAMNSGSSGGGIYNNNGSLTLIHVTIATNSASSNGGGLYNDSGTISMTNSIVAGNFATTDDNIRYGGTFNTNTCITVGDPLLAPLGDYGGPTQTMPPLPGSPAIDAAVVSSLTTDQRGVPRPLDGNGDGSALCDIGAYESEEIIVSVVVAITNPASGTMVSNQVSSIPVSGTNSASVVGTMVWTNAANAVGGEFPVLGFVFHVSDVPLSHGANLITVSGTNVFGITASDSITITRSSEHDGASRIHYVSTGGGNAWPYTNWVTAAASIQDAVDAASSGDTVLVNDGTYSRGGAEVSSMSNRVALTQAITLQSVNGPQATFIVGAEDSGGGNGPAAVRCAYLSSGAVISGFTLTNGHTQSSDDGTYERSAGGILLDGGGTVSNCEITGNSANLSGGAAYCNSGGTLNNCLISGNSASSSGGGIYCVTGGTLSQCTLSGNSANSRGGGLVTSGGVTVNNCILWGNVAAIGHNWFGEGGTFSNACTTPTVGSNCIFSDPQFVNAGTGDYHLQSNSPCIDAGTTLPWITDDIEGTSRPLNGDGIGAALPDIGAYEHISALYSTDGDPHTDYEEYIAGTDPADSNQWFRIAGFSTGVPSTIWFDPAFVTRQYSLLYCTNLVDGLWMEVAGQIDIAGSGGTNSLVHTNSFPAVFYRVDVEVSE